MAKIKISTAELAPIHNQLRRQAQVIDDVADTVSRVLSDLDMQVASTEGIRQTLSMLQRKSRKEHEMLLELSDALNHAIGSFAETDQTISERAEELHYLTETTLLGLAYSGAVWATGELLALNTKNYHVGEEQIRRMISSERINAIFGVKGEAVPTDLSKIKAIEKGLPQEETKKESVYRIGMNEDGRSIDFSVLGYERDSDGIDGYLAKLTGDETVPLIRGVTAVTSVAVSAVTLRGEGSTDWDFLNLESETKEKKGIEIKGSQSAEDISLDELDGTVRNKKSGKVVSGRVSATAGITGATLDYKTTIGTEKYNGTVDNVKLLDADAGISGGFNIGEDGLAVMGKAEVGASLAEVEGSASVKVAGVEAKATVSAEVGFGASIEGGWNSETQEFSFGIGAALGVGGKVKFKIKIPKLW